MPYIIKKVSKTGYKVCKIKGDKKCFSNKPLPLSNAKKQLKVLYLKGGSFVLVG